MLGIQSAAFSHEKPLNAPCDSFITRKGDTTGKALAQEMQDLGLAQILALACWVSQASRCESWFCRLPIVQP